MNPALRLLDPATAAVFGSLSRLRGARVFHPLGVAFEARWEPARDATRADHAPLGSRERPAIVRLSRAVGLPPSVPDILGVAVKVLDVHGPGRDQDLLLASVGRGPVASRLLVPRWRFAGTPFSTILPYDLGGQRTAVVARVRAAGSSAYRDLASAAAPQADVRVSAATGGDLGWVRLGDRLPQTVADDLRFDPWHTGETLRPVGGLNRLRRPAYQASQRGRGAPTDGTRGGHR